MLKLEVKLARKRADALRCQYLIAEGYNHHYDIFFSRDFANPDARIEPYPDRYVMGLVDGDLVATAGIYLRSSYVERYGGVTEEDIRRQIEEAGALERYSVHRRREYTKLVIRKDWEGRGLGAHFFAATHSRDFLQAETSEPHVITCCAKVSIFEGLYASAGIRTRRLKAFPVYQVHSPYRTEDDPMESRLILPELDIPPEMYSRTLPMTLEVDVAEENDNG